MLAFTRIRDFAERNYLLALALLSGARLVIEIPLIHHVIETSFLHLLVEPTGYQLFIYTMIAAILSGIHFNAKRLESIEANLAKKISDFQERIDYDLKYHGSFLPRIRALMQEDGGAFSHIAGRVLDEQIKIFSHLQAGVFSVQLELMGRMQMVLMKVFHRRMDAVSHADLKLWKNINQNSANLHQDGRHDFSQFDKDLGWNYYLTTLNLAGPNRTELSRIFLLDRYEVEKEIDSLAEIFRQHIEDRIGIALVFKDNLGEIPSEWFSTAPLQPSEPRIDFALFDGDKAATFFRKNRDRYGDRFEAVLNKDGWAELMLGQREIHKTLLIASVFGTQRFYESVFGRNEKGPLEKSSFALYDANERSDIKKCIELLRDRLFEERQQALPLLEAPVNTPEWEQMFSVTVATTEYATAPDKTNFLRQKIEDSLSKSRQLRYPIPRFEELIKMATHEQED